MMRQSQQSAPTSPGAPPAAAAKTGLVLGLLIALFAGGILLLYVLTRTGSEIPLAGKPQAPDSPTPATAAESQDARADEAPATRAELAALQAGLADARARIESLSEQTASLAETRARVDALEDGVAAARAAAEAAAKRTAEVAQRYGELTADYAKLGAQFTREGVLIRLDETALAFAPGSSDLPANADTALREIAAFLARYPGQQALLRGHTDATGGADANLRLSEQRAGAVRAALVALGIPGERLRTEGMGAAEPIADNGSTAGRSKNRRVDILLRPNDTTTTG